MIAPVLLPIVRRAMLDFLAEVGGEQSDDTLARQLVALGHITLARRDVGEQLRWLGEQKLATVSELGPYIVGEILPDGEDVAAGRLRIDGISRHRTGARAGTAG